MIYKWGELIALEYGKPVKDKARTDGQYPVYGTNGQIGTSNLTPLCDHPSFILGRKGAYRGVHYSSVPFSVIDTAFYAVNLHPDILDIKWAYYRFLTYDINSMDSGSAIPSTDRYEIYAIEVDLPDIDEQKREVKLLECFDDKIANITEINDNLELQAAALIARYQTTTDTVITLHDIMDFENGFAFQSSTYLAEGAYRIITIKNVQDGRIDSDGAAYIDSIPPRMKNGCRLHIGDALLSLTGNVGRAGIVCEENLLLNQRVAKIVPHNPDLLPFLYFVYRLPSTKVMLESIAKGTAQLNLSPVETLKLTIPFDHETAIQLSRNLAPVYRAIVVNNQESIALAHTRDSLLPKLMSGEIDVSDIQL